MGLMNETFLNEEFFFSSVAKYILRLNAEAEQMSSFSYFWSLLSYENVWSVYNFRLDGPI